MLGGCGVGGGGDGNGTSGTGSETDGAGSTSPDTESDSGASSGSAGSSGTGGTGASTSTSSTSSGDPGSPTSGAPKFDVGVVDPPSTEGCTKVDFLFVIDTSGTMSQEQAALQLAYPGFMQQIEATGIEDYHVAVTTADMGRCGESGERGAFVWQPEKMDPECYPLPRRYIEGPGASNVAEFQCIAEIFGGGVIEQPIQGAYAAVVDRIQDGTNPVEFRRSDALLVVLYITDEDDQSQLEAGADCVMEPVTLYTQLYEQAVLKGNVTAGVFIAISGPETESCSSVGLGSASAAPRLHEFVNHWGPRGHWSNLCDGNFPAALGSALDAIEFGCDGFDPEG